MFFKSRCYNGGNKHDYRGRYSEKAIGGQIPPLNSFMCSMAEIKSLFYAEIYEKDVCKWCGNSVEK